MLNRVNRKVALSAAWMVLLAGATVGVASDARDGGVVPAGAKDAAAFARLAAEAPGVRVLELDGALRRVYGPNLSTGTTAAESVAAFLEKYATVFGVAAADLSPWSIAGDGANTTPLMAEEDGSYRFTMTSFRQTFQGLPVFRADLRLLTRNTGSNDLVWAGNALRPVAGFVMDPAVLEAPAAQAAIDDAELRYPGIIGGQVTPPELVVWTGVDANTVAPRLALTFTATTAAQSWEPGYGRWLIVADAATGRMLWSESQVHDVDVSGRISGQATTGIRAAECNPEADTPMPYALVTIGALSAYADVNGNYTVAGVPAGSYTVSTSPRGRFFDTFNPSARVAVTSQSNDPNVQLNAANTDQVVRAGVNAYYQANVVRDMVVAANPAYPTIGGQLNFRVNVAVSGTCNAFYDGNSINFYNSGGGCYNTAFYDVVHHEYGHHVVQSGGSGQGQYGEGMGDCMGVMLSDQPILGLGFESNCNAGIRTAANTRQYPQDPNSVEIHAAGQLISGCVWSTRNELVAAGVPNYSTLLKRLCVNSVPMHSGSTIAPDITVDWLTLDDTDGNINNGTPHYTQINNGFTAHNMDGPALQLIDFEFPDGLPSEVAPGAARAIRVNVIGIAGTPVDNSGRFSFRIGSGADTSAAMTRTGANQYLAILPAQACGSSITYSFSAQATGGGTVVSPAGAPAVGYGALAVTGSSVRFSDDFNTNRGWVASNTAQSGGTASGNWARGAQLDGNGASPTTDYDGSGQLFGTDLRAGAGLGTYDVDWNIVRLTSPAMDASGGLARISYARWFSNNTGGGPDDDRFLVEVSGDNGAAWSTLEAVGPNAGEEMHGGWYYKTFLLPPAVSTAQFKIRFTTSDNVAIPPAGANTGSVTEAFVDAVSLRVYECAPPACAADFNGDGFLDFFDYDDYVNCFETGTCPAGKTADFNGDGFADFFDYDAFVAGFEAGC